MEMLERFKLYAHVDHDDDDVLIGNLLRAADTMIRDVTGKQPPREGDELFGVAVLQLAAHWYENRTPVTDASNGNVRDVPFTLQTLLNHISMSSRYPEAVANGTDE